jgi:hypothetical protein
VHRLISQPAKQLTTPPIQELLKHRLPRVLTSWLLTADISKAKLYLQCISTKVIFDNH